MSIPLGMEIQNQPFPQDKVQLKVSHSPTSSTSSGPNTPTNENPILDAPRKFPNETQTSLDLLRETEVVRAPKQRTLSPEVLDFLASPQEPEEPALLLTYNSLENRSQRSSVEPIVKLKIRYVARDLWQTISFPTNITVAQARDVCLLRCNLWLDHPEGCEAVQVATVPNEGVAVQESFSTEMVPSKLKKRQSMQGITADGKPEFALFWNAAGHWLDDFRRLDSYALRSLDILELQVRSEFIFIQPTLYNEHYAEGHLYKLRGGITPSWKMRWFVLQGRTIWHFRRRKEATPSGSADLSRPFQVQETSAGIPGSADGKETCLVLRFAQKCWWLRALSPEDLDHWRRILITLHREVSDHCAVHYSAKTNIEDINDIKLNRQGSQHSEDNESGSGSGISGGMRIKAGYMYRRTPITHAFRERYFVLRGKELSCYKSDRFDKKNNTARVIALHTVEATAYESGGRYYIRIIDKQAGQEDEGFVTDPNRKKKDIRSILSSTKSLPARAATWLGKGNGSQLDTEYLYVDNRSDWESWRSALESIAQVDITLTNPGDFKAKAATNKSSSKSVATNLSSTGSVWSRLSGKKSIFTSRSKTEVPNASTQTDEPSRLRTPGSRFSTFLKERTNTPSSTGISNTTVPSDLTQNPFSPSSKYDDIDERDEMTDLELSLKTSQFEMDFPSPPPFPHPHQGHALDQLSPLDRLLADNAREKEFNGIHLAPTHSAHHNSTDRDAHSSHSGIPSVDSALKGPAVASHKFMWFKKKP